MNDKRYTQEMIRNLNDKLKTKQEALKFDNTPTKGSVNPVTSEGIKEYADASKGTVYKAGKNITISNNNVISSVNTTYTAGTNISISENNVISSTTDVSGTDDGENWSSLSVNGTTKSIPHGCKIKEDEYLNEGEQIQGSGLTHFEGSYIWTDGENIYYSSGASQYILEQSTFIWSVKAGEGLTSFYGCYIGTDGENIYYSNNTDQYVLDKSTSTWSSKTWIGLTSFDSTYIGTDGKNIYYSKNGTHYILDKNTSAGEEISGLGLTDFNGNHIGTDGEDIYYSYNETQYYLSKSNYTGRKKTGYGGFASYDGQYVWTDNKNVYYSSGSNQYILNKNNSRGDILEGTGLSSFYSHYIWIDGENIYYSRNGENYHLQQIISETTVLARVAETGDYKDLKNKIIINPDFDNDYEILLGLQINDTKYEANNYEIIDGNSNIGKAKNGTLTPFAGHNVGTDGENIYYSQSTDQFIFDRATAMGISKTGINLTDFEGRDVWTDGENIYYSYNSGQYVLDKNTSTWTPTTWSGLTSFVGRNIGTDGGNIYYYYYNVSDSASCVLNKDTSTGEQKNGNILIRSADNIWTDGENVYCSIPYAGSYSHYVLDKNNSTWNNKTWSGFTKFEGRNVWTDGENIYYSSITNHYILDKNSSKGSAKTWVYLTDFYGCEIGTDGENIYYSNGQKQFQLEKNSYIPKVLANVAETGDYNDLKDKPIIPEEKNTYIYSIAVNNGVDTIVLLNVNSSSSLQNEITFSDLINIIHIGTLGVEGDYTSIQGTFGFISQKNDTQFTLSFSNNNSYIFMSSDNLTITSYLEQDHIFYSTE